MIPNHLQRDVGKGNPKELVTNFRSASAQLKTARTCMDVSVAVKRDSSPHGGRR